jgi:hypothetical protein
MHRNKDNTLGAEPFTLLIRRSRLAIHRKEMRKLGCKSCNLYRVVFFRDELGKNPHAFLLLGSHPPQILHMHAKGCARLTKSGNLDQLIPARLLRDVCIFSQPLAQTPQPTGTTRECVTHLQAGS